MVDCKLEWNTLWCHFLPFDAHLIFYLSFQSVKMKSWRKVDHLILFIKNIFFLATDLLLHLQDIIKFYEMKRWPLSANKSSITKFPYHILLTYLKSKLNGKHNYKNHLLRPSWLILSRLWSLKALQSKKWSLVWYADIKLCLPLQFPKKKFQHERKIALSAFDLFLVVTSEHDQINLIAQGDWRSKFGKKGF